MKSKLDYYLEAVVKRENDSPEKINIHNINIDDLSKAFGSFLDDLKEMGVSENDIRKSQMGYMQMLTENPTLIAEAGNIFLSVSMGKYLTQKQAIKFLDKAKKYDFTMQNPTVYKKYINYFTTGDLDLTNKENKMISE